MLQSQPTRPRDANLFTTLSLVWVAMGLACLLNFDTPLLYLVDIFNLPITSACLLWTLVMAICRQNVPALVSAVGLMILLAAYSPQVFSGQPKPAPEASAHLPIRLLFHNVNIENRDPEAISSLIAQGAPDIAVLIETSPVTLPGIIEANKLAYPHRQVHRDMVILSRYPVSGTEHPKSLSVLRAQVETPHGLMELAIVHLTRPWPFQRGSQHDQVRRLTEFMSPYKKERLIVVGDFNTTPSSRLLQDFARENKLKSAPALWGTWPSKLPGALRIAIDNGFSGAEWSITHRLLMGADSGSDHLPVIFQIESANTGTPNATQH